MTSSKAKLVDSARGLTNDISYQSICNLVAWYAANFVKLFLNYSENLYYCIHNQATKWILHIIRIVDIHSVMFRGITEIVYKNDCNDEQRYLNVWYTYITALNRYVFEKKATVTKIENQMALIFALKKSCCRFRSIW